MPRTRTRAGMPTTRRRDRLASWAPTRDLPMRQVDTLEPATGTAPWASSRAEDVADAHVGVLTTHTEMLRMVQQPELFFDWQLVHTLHLLARMTFRAHTQPDPYAEFWDAAMVAFLDLPMFEHLRSYDCDTCETAVFVQSFTDPCPHCGH